MITVFGSINIDLVSRVTRLAHPGETITGSDYSLVPGGKGANQALAAARAGANVRLVGAVGRDELARRALVELRAGGVDLQDVAHRDGTTGLAIILVDDDGENIIVVTPGANATVTADQAAGIAFTANDTLLLQMEVPYREGRQVAELARRNGARVVLSIAPFTPLSRDDIAPATILVVNEHEARDFAAHHDIAGADVALVVENLAESLGKTIIATLGADGAVAAGEAGVVRAPALAVTPVDTTGAGDTFAGVLAASLDDGADLQTAMAHACIAGSLATTKAGAQPSFPTKRQIEEAGRGKGS